MADIDCFEKGKPNAITLLGYKFVAWQDTNGGWQAARDVCPHRYAQKRKLEGHSCAVSHIRDLSLIHESAAHCCALWNLQLTWSVTSHMHNACVPCMRS